MSSFPAIEKLRAAIREIEKSAEMALHDYNVEFPEDPICEDVALEETIQGQLVMTEDLNLHPEHSAILLDLLNAINS